jgi:hypothetical protein
LLAGACKSDPPPPPSPVVLTITAPNAPAKIIRILFDDHPIVLIDDQHWKLTLPSGSDPTTMASRFKVALATTCFEEAMEVVAVSPTGELQAKWPAPAILYVDREGVGSAASVSVGSMVVDGTSAKVLPGACQGARDIRVDDSVVGQLGTSTIVDAKGGHCYELMTNGFPSARLDAKRVYERPLDLFLPPEIPTDKTALRRCENGSASLAELMGSPANGPAKTGANGPVPGAFTANPHSKTKPPPPPPAKPPPKKPRR